jgi:ABC-type branched-subunit amino acid transport system ATPase component
MTPAPAVLLQTLGLTKRYGGVAAVDNIAFDLARGEVCGVIGPNGAGKSTLIDLLSGAVAPTTGRVRFDGIDITRAPAFSRAALGIGRTFQTPRPFLDMTVRENVLAARYALNPFGSHTRALDACSRILEETGLADAASTQARALPLLRRKRLEVARALALRPKLLLLDEVGAGLIDAEISELIELIHTIRSRVQAIVVVEHVLRVVRECCDRLVVMTSGRTLAQGKVADVLANEEVAAVYLGTAHRARGVETAATAASIVGTASVSVSSRQLVAGDAAEPETGEGVPLLELRAIEAGYGQARALNGIDLAVRRGTVVAILGTNGAGKTTLANVISGTIRPTSGELRIRGQDVTGEPAHRISRLGIAACMEGSRIFAPLSVEENLLLGARGVERAEQARRLESVYELFTVLKRRRKSGGTSMSGGEQQMLAIGRALMSRPALVVFDEISFGLAPAMIDRLYATLAELRTSGLTMLLVEQDVERALELADDVHVMEHGAFALSSRASAIRDDPILRELYIGTADEA